MRIQSSSRSPAVERPLSDENQAVIRNQYDWTLSALEREYPVIDPDSSEYNADLMFEVYHRLKDLVSKGSMPARALEIAASEVLRPYDTH